MKDLLVGLLLVVSSLAEPPIDNRYLPPERYTSSPSQEYGAPGFGGQRLTAGFRSRPASNYATLARSQSLSNQYIPPQPQNQYLAPISNNQALASQYQAPVPQYQAPVPPYQGRPSLNQAPSAQYGLPKQAIESPRSYTAPSQEYGPPELGTAGSRGRNDFSSRRYLPPGRGGYGDESDGEPANYNFEYMVLDPVSGNDFGHRESRQGDRAEGIYYVLLPDGRKQTVMYEADQDGYKPRISYEDTGVAARGRGGYDRNAQYNANQYENGPY